MKIILVQKEFFTRLFHKDKDSRTRKNGRKLIKHRSWLTPRTHFFGKRQACLKYVVSSYLSASCYENI